MACSSQATAPEGLPVLPFCIQSLCLTGRFSTIPIMCYCTRGQYKTPLSICPSYQPNLGHLQYLEQPVPSPPKYKADINRHKKDNAQDVLQVLQSLSFCCADYPKPHESNPLNKLFQYTEEVDTCSPQHIVHQLFASAPDVCTFCLDGKKPKPDSVSSSTTTTTPSSGKQLRITRFFQAATTPSEVQAVPNVNNETPPSLVVLPIKSVNNFCCPAFGNSQCQVGPQHEAPNTESHVDPPVTLPEFP